MLQTATSKARVIALAGFAAVTVAGAALWHTDLLVARGFGKALEGAKPTLSFQPATRGTQLQAVAGDEGYWLTRADVESPTPFAKPLSLGDRITISSGDGRTHQLEIVDLKAAGTTLSVSAAGQALPRLLIVTCRSVGEGGKQSQMRFIVEADAVDPGTVARPKTL